MDHRCLYGHRVPSSFAFAIQNRMCPMCGANTVTVAGYQVARKLTQEAGLDAHAAFQVIKVIEGEWNFQPINAHAAGAEPASPPAATLPDPPAPMAALTIPSSAILSPAIPSPAAPAPVEEVMIMEPLDADEPPRAARPAPVANLSDRGIAAVAVPISPVSTTPVNITPRVKPVPITQKVNFESAEEDFFKS